MAGMSKSQMDERIAVGDLVQIVRWECCGRFLGRIFTVGEFFHHGPWRADGRCGALHRVPTLAVDDKRYMSAPVEWLKKIPPLNEPAETYTTEKHKEPA